MFKKIMVANRGEIALRVMRTAREMGIATLAIYSEADREAPHVRFADEAICVGPPASAQSYLRADYLIEQALAYGVDAIHPGYGFLSENAAFCRAVTEAGMAFIGPSPAAIDLMGSKLASKKAVGAYGVPMVPGTDEAITDVPAAKKRAVEIGYPILIKASAGGGGKGMRVVEEPADFEEQMDRAVSEATSSFGDGSVFIEKFVTSPRHIEIQVLGDTSGTIVHLFERECSIQRRHQKVIEEAPSCVLTDELREAMGKSACDVARSCSYTGAGTVEFLLDGGNYYFLEMNTRLQVEHPVTEMVTGVDLVREQINIAYGLPISFAQKDLRLNGHAIELRVYAEDPTNNFLPDIGRLETYRRPQGPGVRVDDGLEEGMQIPIYYDPMIAKLAVWGVDREAAIGRMRRAVAEYHITGLKTTLPFGDFVMRHPAFISGDFDTRFVKLHFDPADMEPAPSVEAEEAAVLLLQHLQESGFSKTPFSKLGSAGQSVAAGGAAGGSISPGTGLSSWQRNRS